MISTTTIDSMMCTVVNNSNKSGKVDSEIYKAWLNSFDENSKEFLILKGIKDGRIQ